MEATEARRLLGVDASTAESDIRRRYGARLEELESRADAAPTEALRAKFDRQLDELRQAGEVLFGAPSDDDQDLPLSRPLGVPSSAIPNPTEARSPPAADARYRLGEGITVRVEIKHCP